jgi:hypothetical protein
VKRLVLSGAVAFALACVIGGLVAWKETRSQVSGYFPGQPITLREGERIDAHDSHADRGLVTSVLGSSANSDVVYATPDSYGLYAGSGRPFRWHRVAAASPGLDVAIGNRPEVLYGATDALYRSTNGGKTWQQLSCNYNIDGVAVSPTDPSSLYLAGQPGDDALSYLGGYYRSTDGGKTWARSTVGAPTYEGPEEQALAVDPRNPNDVTVAEGGGGLYRTLNGHDWAFTRFPGPKYPYPGGQEIWSLAYGAGSRPALWAGTTSGVFRRTAQGTWVRAGLRGHDLTAFPDTQRASVVLALLGSDGMGRECVDRTTDGGETWTRVGSLPCNIWGATVQRSSGLFYAWARHAIYRSTDHGRTWTQLPPLPIGSFAKR